MAKAIPFKYVRNVMGIRKEPEGIVRRVHWTYPENIPSIREHGLTARKYWASAPEGDESVYTWATDDALPYEYSRDPYKVPLVIDMPEEVYAGMRRHTEFNPAYRQFSSVPDGLRPLEKGGATDIFAENIPPEYIREVRFPDTFHAEGHARGWKPGDMDVASINKVDEAWKKASNRKKYGNKENFLDAMADACRDSGIPDLSECVSYYLLPATRRRGILPIMKSRFVKSGTPVVERADEAELERWRKARDKKGGVRYRYEPFGSVAEPEL